MAGAASAQPMKALPGISYQVLASGPVSGALALRSDTVSFKYVGRFADGEIFSASPKDGAEPMSFAVHDLIPGMSAALQLMRPGDHWRITVPAYLGYGSAGRKTVPSQARRDIPRNATLVFDVELVSIAPPAAK
jgi:FKBP-type peptidyl-prolyl cis-trans isomerase